MFTLRKLQRKKPRALGVLLLYNDGDILEAVIKSLLENNHQIVAWNHGSTDETEKVINRYKSELLENTFVPRDFDFYKLYPAMSENIMKQYQNRFDWISWPDDDEILEGPKRDKSYYEYITDVYNSKCNWIQFNNFNFWYTSKDDPSLKSPVDRIKHYSLFPDCAPRIRSWRASCTNIRKFNHNALDGVRFPTLFNLRHYPMRSKKQALRRVKQDRANIQRAGQNYHYNRMKEHLDLLTIDPKKLQYDTGVDLKKDTSFNWRTIYGNG